jgi:hypothetical protein
MTEIPIDRGAGDAGTGNRAEVEREKTRQALIQGVVTVALVILYMAYSLLRDRAASVLPIGGASDDWDEGAA